MASFAAPLVGPGLIVDVARAFDLSRRVRFDASQETRAFGLPPAQSSPVHVGAFVGDVRQGGSCNCETHSLTPHGDGTHTECVGHVLADRVAVLDVVPAHALMLVQTLVVTCAPVRLDSVSDDVAGNHAPDDLVVDELTLTEALARLTVPSGFTARALVVRTRTVHAQNARAPAPYVTADAALFIRERGFMHVLVDLPSLDRDDDGGLLGAHRAFFDLAPMQRSLHGQAPTARTVTELIHVDDAIADGAYALSLQLAPMVADAVPSRPLLFPLVTAAPSWLTQEPPA